MTRRAEVWIVWRLRQGTPFRVGILVMALLATCVVAALTAGSVHRPPTARGPSADGPDAGRPDPARGQATPPPATPLEAGSSSPTPTSSEPSPTTAGSSSPGAANPGAPGPDQPAPQPPVPPALVGPVSIIFDPGSLGEHVHTLPPGLIAGDLILVAVEMYEDVAWGGIPGFTGAATATGGAGYQPKTMVFYRWAQGGETQVTVPLMVNNGKTSAAAVFRQVNRQSPFVGPSTVFNDGDPAITTGGITATAGTRLVLVVGLTSSDAAAAWDTPAGMTKQAEAATNQYNSLVVYDQAVGAGFTGGRTVIRAAPGHQSAVLLGLRPA